MKQNDFTRWIARGLIVSCQASPGEPFDDPRLLALMAKAASLGGAVGVRVNGSETVTEVQAAVALPIIAIQKRLLGDGRVCITPTFDDARDLAGAGAQIIAIAATERPRPGGRSAADLIARIQGELGAPVMADISTFEEGLAAARAGAAAVATTLSGYTPQSPKQEAPDLELVRRLAQAVEVPIVAEGRYETPELAAEALRAGAWAVVTGTAITKPQAIVARFTRTMKAAI